MHMKRFGGSFTILKKLCKWRPHILCPFKIQLTALWLVPPVLIVTTLRLIRTLLRSLLIKREKEILKELSSAKTKKLWNLRSNKKELNANCSSGAILLGNQLTLARHLHTQSVLESKLYHSKLTHTVHHAWYQTQILIFILHMAAGMTSMFAPHMASFQVALGQLIGSRQHLWQMAIKSQSTPAPPKLFLVMFIQ